MERMKLKNGMIKSQTVEDGMDNPRRKITIE